MDFTTLYEASHLLKKDVTPLVEDVDADTANFTTLTIRNLKYVINERRGPWWKGACFRKVRRKTVLNNVTMSIESGQLTAVAGSSGSGKTSLLDVLSFRTEGKVSGDLVFKRRVCTKAMMKLASSYVMQADRLLPNLTVRETLRYTAYLKLPNHYSKSQVEGKVQRVINEMGLHHVAESRIGGAVIRGISGGEKRRVTIAIQLLQDPEILLLDEPTSGLDSFTARYLVSNLADLAHRGRIVILTIHQPRSDIFKLFDQVAILSRGDLVYAGPADQLVPYFTGIGYPCPIYSNPMDRYIDVASVDRRDAKREEETSNRVYGLVESYANSDIHREIQQKCSDSMASVVKSRRKPQPSKGPGWPRIMNTIISRMFVNLYRDRSNFISRFLTLPFYVVFVVIFLGKLEHNQESVQDRTGLLYQSVSAPPYIAIVNAVALFPPIREVYYRECRDGLYSAASFILAYAIHCMPFVMVASTIFGSTIYWICGMYPSVDRFAMYLANVFILSYSGELIIIATMGLFLNPQLANNMISLFFTAAILLSTGFLRSVESMPRILQWLGYSMIYKYSSEIFVANEYHNLTLTCDRNSTTPCLFPNGDAYIKMLFPHALDNIARNFYIMTAFTGGFLILAYLTFKIRGIPNLQ
ncbi:ATP-binding cassette sub-family G member 5-like [Gigantopelta aegis]|uniref:ATP-binding cassette sub-family G member 5-like n=1 Tax=Gigantopelta aegis TaxID=1735272 RepID=UPI001B88A35A|nr:ATP-binding cassette sub-family G member 5-like [Gigantopelta aegis]